MNDPFITNDAVVLGLLIGILAFVFITSEVPPKSNKCGMFENFSLS